MALLGLISLFIILAYVFTDSLNSLKSYTQDWSASFFWLSNLPGKAQQWVDKRLMSRERLLQENESLRTENLILKRKLQLNASLAAEKVHLRQLLNAAEFIEDRVLIAELIGVSPDLSSHWVLINRGATHGVYRGQTLLDTQGIMGQVVTVGQHSAKVLLVTDATHALPVQINRNGVRLIAEGVGRLDQLRLPHVAITEDIVEGDLLVSSGLGQRFPVGYPVAEVIKVVRDPSNAFAQVTAKPTANINRRRHVLLVFDRSVTEQ